MIFEKNQVRNVLLEQGVESFIAAAVANSLDGTIGTGVGVTGNQTEGDDDSAMVQFDGMVSAERWPAVYDKLQSVPTRLIEIDEMPTTNGRNVEFTIRVSEKPLEMDETARVIEGLRDTWQQSSNHPSEESFVGHDEDYQVDAD